jgi:type IV pilus assembly protein PilB
MKTRALSEVFLQSGLISPEKMRAANSRRVLSGESLLEIVLSDGLVTFADAADILEKNYGIASCDLDEVVPEKNALDLLDYTFCVRNKVLPIRLSGFRLVTAMYDPINHRTADDIFVKTGCRVEALFAPEEQLQTYINQYYASVRIDELADAAVDETLLIEGEPEEEPDVHSAPAVVLVDSLLETAVMYQSSDIHIEPGERDVRVRYRVDGHLREFQRVDISLLPNMISRIKVLGQMDAAEKRLPQDGHFSQNVNDIAVDFRISTIPTVFGEKAAIRLMYKEKSWLPKEQLGFFQDDLQKITQLFHNPYGALLLTGPTGCGKSTTLASFMKELNRDEINIVTIEDPVEHILPGVNQINVNNAAGLTFANALRSILRQDPDILMIGEIRDEETAQLAVQAALTGHLVLSTLHTFDALSAITRLVDMNVPDYLAAAAVKGIISQRLVRRICERCKINAQITELQAKLLELPEDTIVCEGMGCSYCGGSGYKGRFAVYEFLALDETLSEMIEKRMGMTAIKKYLKEINFHTIRENAVRNVLQGNTSADEVINNVIFF